MTENNRLPRSVVVQLCQILGHDADRVNAIAIYPNSVSVTYDHFISDTVFPYVATLGVPMPVDETQTDE